MKHYIALILLVSNVGCGGNFWRVSKVSDSKLYELYEGQTAETWTNIKSHTSPIRGWEYVVDRLSKKGIELEYLNQVYSSARIPLWTPISYKVRPMESKHIYKELANKSAIQNAKTFLHTNLGYFRDAENQFSVPKEVLASIIQVETQCGKNTGSESIIYWLSRLVSAGFPLNVEYNYQTSKETPKPTLKELEERAQWLEEEFSPHLISALLLAKASNSDPFDIKGSKGGAIGLPQFLPGNVEKYGVDGDKSGTINIHTEADAIFSVANFLSKKGWRNHLTDKEKHSVILEYNRSTAYADTVLSLAKSLK